ncbi:hypothetical protein SK128_020336, partial [Halocaridina rubra]
MEPPAKRKYEASLKLKVIEVATKKPKSTHQNQTGIPTMMAYVMNLVICMRNFSKRSDD